MSPRVVKLDAKGKPRRRPSELAERYYVAIEGNPEFAKAHYKAALAVGVPPKRASQMAWKWDSNPYRKDTVALLFRHEVVRPAARKAAAWHEDLLRRGTKAEKAGKLSAALEALKVEAEYMPPEDMPKKNAAPSGGDTYNFNGPNPFTGWSLEELAAWREAHRAKLVEGKVVNRDAT